MKLEIGTPVKWISSNTRKIGEIVAVVPAGRVPKDVGYPKIDGGSPRDHESYIVRGQKTDWRGSKPAGPKANYWPRVSLIEMA